MPGHYMDAHCKIMAAFNHEEAKECKEIYLHIYKVVKANHKKILPENFT